MFHLLFIFSVQYENDPTVAISLFFFFFVLWFLLSCQRVFLNRYLKGEGGISVSIIKVDGYNTPRFRGHTNIMSFWDPPEQCDPFCLFDSFLSAPASFRGLAKCRGLSCIKKELGPASLSLERFLSADGWLPRDSEAQAQKLPMSSCQLELRGYLCLKFLLFLQLSNHLGAMVIETENQVSRGGSLLCTSMLSNVIGA